MSPNKLEFSIQITITLSDQGHYTAEINIPAFGNLRTSLLTLYELRHKKTNLYAHLKVMQWHKIAYKHMKIYETQNM